MPADPVSCHEPELQIIRDTLCTVAQNHDLLSTPEIRDFVADQCRAAEPAMRRLLLAARDFQRAGHRRAAKTIGAAAMLFEAIINPQLKGIDGRPATRPGDRHFGGEVNEVIQALDSIIDQATCKACDAPNERGYVERPSDPSAYVPACKIIAEHTPEELPLTEKRLVAIVENPANGVRWSRPLTKAGRSHKHRRLVHLGDWLNYLGRHAGPDAGDGWPATTPAEIERRKAAIRRPR